MKAAMRATFDNLKPDADRALSHLHAKKIAESFGSKAIRNTRIVIGEPACDYKIPCHLTNFWCKAKVSEVTIIFESNHKKGLGAASPFCFTLTPWRNMGTDTEVIAATSLIGQSVFRQQHMEDQPILACLGDDQVRSELSAVVREGVTFLFCSSAQLMAEFDSSEAAVSIRRIKAFQSLQLALYDFIR
jgi:hypothetical protein